MQPPEAMQSPAQMPGLPGQPPAQAANPQRDNILKALMSMQGQQPAPRNAGTGIANGLLSGFIAGKIGGGSLPFGNGKLPFGLGR